MTLTPSDRRILNRVSHPYWPRLTLFLVVVVVVCGLLAIGLAIMSCVRMFHAVSDAAIQPDITTVLSESWLSLLIGSTAWMSAIFIWITRRYGLLIRKLGGTHDR